MSTIESIASASAVGAGDHAAASRIPKQILGQEDFLKLLTVQFASQDPLNPMEDTAFIAQMAEFSSLEIMNNMSSSLASLSSSQQLFAAQALLGKSVELLDTSGSPVSGMVTAVRTEDDKTMITVNRQEYDLASVSRVKLNAPAEKPQP